MDERGDIKVHVRFKLSALWASLMFCYIYNDYFQLYQPGQLGGMLHGMMGSMTVTPGLLLMFAFVLAIPASMIFLSIALQQTVARWLNIVFAVIYSIIDILTMFGSWSYYIFFNAVETVFTILILWYAIKWSGSLRGVAAKSPTP